MSDQQARDFYTEDSVLAFGSIMFVMWGNKHAVIVRDTEGRDQFLSKDMVRHYPDGAPLGKFKGIRMRGHVMFYDDSEHGITDAVSLGEVNRILGAEVDDD